MSSWLGLHVPVHVVIQTCSHCTFCQNFLLKLFFRIKVQEIYSSTIKMEETLATGRDFVHNT